MNPTNNKKSAAAGSGADEVPKVTSTAKKGEFKQIHQKKHHDPKNANQKPYRFGIPGAAIFERKGTITKLVQYKGKAFNKPNTVKNTAGFSEFISDKFELKSIKNSLHATK